MLQLINYKHVILGYGRMSPSLPNEQGPTKIWLGRKEWLKLVDCYSSTKKKTDAYCKKRNSKKIIINLANVAKIKSL